jgi:SAM-dependent methyltransferase
MHNSALESFNNFKNAYLSKLSNKKFKLIEIGSLSVNSNIKNNLEDNMEYIGMDIVKGKNVDVVLDDPYKFPFKDKSVDVAISISNFEHTEFFWLTYLEILRVLKDDGLFFLNAPSNSKYHRHETDNWRFYPDSSISLQKWGEYNNFEPQVLEHYTNLEKGRDIWNDYVSITVKNKKFSDKYPDRILNSKKNFTNGRKNNSNEIINFQEFPQDQDNWGWKLYYKLRKFIHKFP